MKEIRVTNGDLASIVSSLLCNPQRDEIDDMGLFEQFCTDIARVVCDYCGGEVAKAAVFTRNEKNIDDFTSQYPLAISPNAASPDAEGGIWGRPIEPARIVIDMDGGIIHEVTSSVPLEYAVYDHDVEGCFDDEIADMPSLDPADGEKTVEVYRAGYNGAKTDAAAVTRAYRAINTRELSEAAGE